MSNPDTPPTFALDPRHPTVLRCGTCGEVVATVDPAALEDPGLALTARQAAAAWPELAEVIPEHEANCGRAGDMADTEPMGVFVHELLTAAPERNGVAEGQLPGVGG